MPKWSVTASQVVVLLAVALPIVGLREASAQSLPVLSVEDLVVDEDVGEAVLTATLSEAASADVTVDWAAAAGAFDTATASADFTVASGTATIAAGSTSTTISVPILNDALDEYDEVLTVSLSGPSSNAALSSTAKQATVTIRDDDALPTVSLQNKVFVHEGDTAQVTLTLSAVSGRDVVATLRREQAGSSELAATPGADFDSSDLMVTIPAGETSVSFDVGTEEDSLDELNESFHVRVGRLRDADNVKLASVASGKGTTTVAIRDDDPLPQVCVEVPTDVNGDPVVYDEAGNHVDFLIKLSAPSGRSVQVQYETKTFSAADALHPAGDDDFTAVSIGHADIPAGDQQLTVSVRGLRDSIDEHNETFQFNLLSAFSTEFLEGAIVVSGNKVAAVRSSMSSAVGTIVDSNDPPVVSVADASATEGEDITFVVSLSEPSSRDVPVQFHTALATAPVAEHLASAADFVAVSAGEVVIPAGDTSATTTVTTQQDNLNEYPEYFEMVLDSALNADGIEVGTVNAQATTTTARGTIRDNDAGTVEEAPRPTTGGGGGGGGTTGGGSSGGGGGGGGGGGPAPLPADSNEPPEFLSDQAERSIPENTESNRPIGQRVTASDPDNNELTYTLDSTGDATFDIDRLTGQLYTEAALDFEMRQSYEVTVTATDPSASDSIRVTISIEDLIEPLPCKARPWSL